MNYSLVFLCAIIAMVSAAAITDDQKHKTDEHAKVCSKEIGITAEAVAKLKAGDFSQKDEKTQCFAKCIFEKTGFMNDKGEFQDKVAIDKLSKGEDKAKVEELVKKCKVTKGDKPCEHAFTMYECYSKAKKVL